MARKGRPLTAQHVLRALNDVGFEVVAIRGSHAKLRRRLSDGTAQTLTVSIHRDLAVGTVQAIFRQARRFVAEADLRRAFFGDP